MTSFHSVAIRQFHKDWQNLFHICRERNIVHYMFGSSTANNYAQIGFGVACRLPQPLITKQAVDPSRLSWKIILEVIFIFVSGRFPILLFAHVCSMSIPLLPIPD